MAQSIIKNHLNSFKQMLNNFTVQFLDSLIIKLDVTYSINFDATNFYPDRDSLNLRLRINNVEFLQQYLIWRRLVAHILMKFNNNKKLSYFGTELKHNAFGSASNYYFYYLYQDARNVKIINNPVKIKL
ncbi:MAG: hypothetical protein ACTSQG_08220 [Promethearchaeota archaeon]